MTVQPVPARALPLPLVASPARRRQLQALARDKRPRCDLDPRQAAEAVGAALLLHPALDRYVPVDEVPAGAEARTVSGTELRALLASGDAIPEWITFPEVAAVLRG